MSTRPVNLSRHLFVLQSLGLVVFLLLIVCLFTKTASFMGANFFHAVWLDQAFVYYTFLGDGWFAVILTVFLYILNKRGLAIKLFCSFILSGLAAQLLKQLFQAPRPKAFLGDQVYAHFIEGVTHGGWTSFPSGHTTTAFAMAATLAFNCRKQTICFLMFWMAVLVGYSRVYLGQHFVEDILAGMILGIASSLFIEYIYPGLRLKMNKRVPAPAYEQSTLGI